MKNNKIGEVLKKYRKLNGYQVRDVAGILQEKHQLNVAEKTIYGWESNQAHPTTDMFLILCEIYQIANIADIFYPSNPDISDFAVSSEERNLVEAYREHPELQPAIKRMLEVEQISEKK